MFSEKYIILLITAIINRIKTSDYTTDGKTYFYMKGISISNRTINIDDADTSISIMVLAAAMEITLSCILDCDVDMLEDIKNMTKKLDKLNRKFINKSLIKDFSLN
jgi:hypothetical protein